MTLTLSLLIGRFVWRWSSSYCFLNSFPVPVSPALTAFFMMAAFSSDSFVRWKKHSKHKLLFECMDVTKYVFTIQD